MSDARGPSPHSRHLESASAPSTPLVGRKKELADVLRSLVGGARLVTLTGPRGIGKTRLAQEVVREYARVYARAVGLVDDALPAAVSDALEDPSTQVLATAVEPVGLAGERVFALRPLAESPAVELLRQRAAEIDPMFDAPWEALAEVVQRVGRVPLELERAAAEAVRAGRGRGGDGP